MTFYDLAVVGAGPAGAAAAVTAARAGLRVVLLEGRQRPGAGPGETLHPGVEPLLDRLGVGDAVRAAGFVRHRGVSVGWDGEPRFQSYGEDTTWRGFQAERRRFAALLLDGARRAGVEVRLGAPVTGIGARDGGATTLGLGAQGALAARWIVDATGSRGALSPDASSDEGDGPPVRVRYGWRGEAAAEVPSFRATRRGWRWDAPVGDGRVAWSEAFVGRYAEAGGAGLDQTWRLRLSRRDDVLLVGDAGGRLDPASSHGILRALMSGIMGGHLIGAAVAGKLAASSAAAAYRTWTTASYRREAEQLRALYRRHPWPDVAAAFGAATRPSPSVSPADRPIAAHR